ncbi:MAG: serine hydrolase domain-containing protein [Acidobacteriota bacterium]
MTNLTRRHFTGLVLAGTQARNLFAATSIGDTLQASMLRRGIPGVVAQAVDLNKVLYSGAFGNRDAASNVALNDDSIFQIASMTKPITSIAALQLVEQGKVSLDEPVSKHLPKLANAQVLEGFDASGNPTLRPAKKAITLRHLLTHTSGISYPTWHAKMMQWSQKNNLGPTAIAPVVPLMFDPGTSWQYGYGIDWTGRLVETLSGLTLQQYFRRNILDPLGMNDTDFGVAPAKFDRLVAIYNRQPDGKFQAGPRTQPPAPTDFNGGGGLSSTANDYVKFTRMLLRHGAGEGSVRILKASTVQDIFKNQIGSVVAGKMKTQQPNVTADVDTNPGHPDKWGLIGLLRGPGMPGLRSEGSTAWAGIYNTFFWVDPKKNIAGVVMMQYLPFYDPEAVGLLTDFERSVYASL